MSLKNASVKDKVLSIVAGATSFSSASEDPQSRNVQETNARKISTLPRSVDNDPSIISFLNRPIAIYSRTITAGDYPTNLLLQIPCMGMLRSQQLWLDKLQGVSMMRATTCMTVVINAPPAVAGCLIVVFNPGDINASSDECFRSDDARVFSQRQHLVIDYAEKQAVFRVPYVQTATSYDLTTDHKYAFSGVAGDPGTIQLRSFYGPNYNGTLPPINLTVYLHYEDVELGPPGVTNNVLNATPPLFIAQIGDVEEETGSAPTPVLDSPNPVVQSEPKSDEVKKEKSSFRFSSILKTVSTVANAVGTFIPEVGEFSYPVSWIADAASRVAAHYGYGSVVNTSTYYNVRPVSKAYMASGDGLNVSSTLSTFVDNEIVPTNAISPSGFDELSIAFLVSRPTFFGGFALAASDTVGTLLSWWPVSPNAGDVGGDLTTMLYTQTTISTTETYTTYHQPTACGGVAYFFNYWRGTMRYHLKAIKTKFHVGRVMIVWKPNAVEKNDVDTYSNAQQYAFKIIWDLSESDTLDFEVPFCPQTQYLISNNDQASISEGLEYTRQYNGSVSVYVVNPLGTSNTVSTTINILAFMSMGDDAQFAVPRFVRPVVNVANIVTTSLVDEPIMVTAQMGMWEHSAAHDGMIATSEMTETPNQAALTVGEDVRSLKTLGNCYSKFLNSYTPATYIRVPSFLVLAHTGGDVVDTVQSNVYDMILSTYAWVRGSTRYLISSVDSTPMSGYVAFRLTMDVGAGSIPNAYESDYATRPYVLSDHCEPVIVPSFMNTIACKPLFATTGDAGTVESQAVRYVRPGIEINTSTEYNLYRAFGDDMQLSGFRGFYVMGILHN
jgi:hypothetical protein